MSLQFFFQPNPVPCMLQREVGRGRLVCGRSNPGSRRNVPTQSVTMALSLEWRNPAEHHFVLGYNYLLDRQVWLAFVRGSINGLIQEGYFAALLLKQQNGWLDSADFKRLSKPCGEFIVYIRDS